MLTRGSWMPVVNPFFHYRNHGADVGRIVVGVLVPEREKEGWTEFLKALGYRHWDETNNPAYGLFL